MSAERRERYARAMHVAIDGDPYTDSPLTRQYEAMADAVLALADTERARDRATIEAYKQAVDRQHAALSSLRDELAEERGRREAADGAWRAKKELADYWKSRALKESEDASAEARDEIDRLNRELMAVNARQRATWALAQRRAQWIFDLQGEKGELREENERLSAELAGARTKTEEAQTAWRAAMSTAEAWEVRAHSENESGGEARRVLGMIRRALGVAAEGDPWSVENMDAVRAEAVARSAELDRYRHADECESDKLRERLDAANETNGRLARELEGTQRALRFETTQLAAEKAHAARLRQRCAEAEEENARGRTVRIALREGRERLSAELSEARDEIRRLKLRLS